MSAELSRSDFLRGSGLAAVAVAIAGCRPTAENLRPNESSQIPLFDVEFGSPEAIDVDGLEWVPDGHLSMMQISGEVRAWVAGAGDTFLLTGASLDTLGNPQKVLSPERTITERGFAGYRAFGSVVPGAQAGELYGFYHQEFWPSKEQSFPFTPEVGLAVSHDNGETWEPRGPILTGFDAKKVPEDKVLGAGHPSAIVVGTDVLVYYVDWNNMVAPGVHVARAPLDRVENPDAWKKYDGKGFSAKAMGGRSVPVISPRHEDLYAAIPSVSFNTDLGKYMAWVETDRGFSVTTSADGIRWEHLSLALLFPQRQSARKKGDTWYSYPTFLSETPSHLETTKEGWVYYSKGVFGQPHTMERMAVRLTPAAEVS